MKLTIYEALKIRIGREPSHKEVVTEVNFILGKVPCDQCGVFLSKHWLKNGKCNGCRNSHLIIGCVK